MIDVMPLSRAVGREQRDQRREADAGPGERDDPEQDRERAAQDGGLPDPGEVLLALFDVVL